MSRRRSLSPMETIIGLFMDIGLAEATAALAAAQVIVGRRMAVDGEPRESSGRRRRPVIASSDVPQLTKAVITAARGAETIPTTAPAPPAAPPATPARRRGRPAKAAPATPTASASGPVGVPSASAGPRRRRPAVTDAPPAAATANELPDQTPGDYE